MDGRLQKVTLVGLLVSASLVTACSDGGKPRERPVESTTSYLQDTCGCTLTGAYLPPAVVLPAARETSPHGIYHLATQLNGSLVDLSITRVDSGDSVYATTVPGSSGWGFSPDDHRFVVTSTTSGVVTTRLVDLSATPAQQVWTSAVATASTAVGFGPKGRYFLFAHIPSPSAAVVNLQVLNATTGAIAHQDAFAFSSPPINSGGAAGWGFGPDDEEFVYAYNSAPTTVSWNLVNLVSKQRLQSVNLTSSQSRWTFSPCGDRIGLGQVSNGALSMTLYDTVNGATKSQLSGVAQSPSFSMRSTTEFHELVAGQTFTLERNAAPTACPSLAALASLTVTPSQVGAGGVATGQVTLTSPALAGGTRVGLVSNAPSLATVPSFVLVPSGANTATFTIPAGFVATESSVTISASLGSTTRTATLGVLPNVTTDRGVAALALSPTSVAGGASSVGTITMNSDHGTVTVTLSSSDPTLARVPASLVIPDGRTTGLFMVATSAVTSNTSVRITVTGPGGTANADLQLTPAQTGANAVVDDSGCQAVTLAANDDSSTGAVDLPFNVNFFGKTYTYFYINNNGNVTFDAPQHTYTPYRITSTTPPIIAPFFADVDTRGSGSSRVQYSYGTIDFGGRQAMCINWINVGYFSGHTDKLNSFQLLLVDRSDRATGDFDIVMNYDRIKWETGDASDGIDGFGGDSAGAGYSAGTAANADGGTGAQFFEFPGTLVNGALLDTNAATGLTRTSRNSLIAGRHIFEVRNGDAPLGGVIAGAVHDNGTPASVVVGAPVQICRASDNRCIFQTITSSSGQFMATGLVEGDYNITVSSPAGSQLLRATKGPIHVATGVTTSVDITLDGPQPLPPGTGLSPSWNSGSGQGPTVYWRDELTLTTTGCAGGRASYTISRGTEAPIRSGTMREEPAGTYTATIAPFYPISGHYTVVLTVTCADAGIFTIAFDIYIDPSGLVRDQLGNPVPSAVVSVFRADDPAGPFAIVPSGSSVLSPNNRSNPDVTDSNGHFGWDVIAGYYYVQAQKAGCTSSDGSSAFFQSQVLTVPPAVTDLELTLNCPVTDTEAPTATAALVDVGADAGIGGAAQLVILSATDNATGSGVAGIYYTMHGAQNGSGFVSGDSASVWVEAPGETTIEYYAVDLAGNRQPTQEIVVRVSGLSDGGGAEDTATGAGGQGGGAGGQGGGVGGQGGGAGGDDPNGGGGPVYVPSSGGAGGSGVGGAGGAVGDRDGSVPDGGSSVLDGAAPGAGGKGGVPSGGAGGSAGTGGIGAAGSTGSVVILDGGAATGGAGGGGSPTLDASAIDLPFADAPVRTPGLDAQGDAPVSVSWDGGMDGARWAVDGGAGTVDGGGMPQGVLDGGIDLGHTAGLDAKSTGKDVGSSGSSGCSCNMSPAPQRYLGFLLVGMAVLARRIRRGRRQP